MTVASGVQAQHLTRRSQDAYRFYDEVRWTACISGFTAGSRPPGSTQKSNLQEFCVSLVITRNEGVRGSNPRVGSQVEKVPADREFLLSPKARRTQHRELRGPRFGSLPIPAGGLVPGSDLRQQLPPGANEGMQRRVQRGFIQDLVPRRPVPDGPSRAVASARRGSRISLSLLSSRRNATSGFGLRAEPCSVLNRNPFRGEPGGRGTWLSTCPSGSPTRTDRAPRLAAF